MSFNTLGYDSIPTRYSLFIFPAFENDHRFTGNDAISMFGDDFQNYVTLQVGHFTIFNKIYEPKSKVYV